MDRHRRREDCVRFDPVNLPLVGGDGEILECDRRLQKSLLILGGAPEVERGSLDRLTPEQLAESGDVRTLDRSDDPGSSRSLAANRGQSLRLGVEGRLEVFERECVVEDRDVTLRHSLRTCGRGCGEDAESRRPAGGETEEASTRQPRLGFAQGAVAIELIE